MMQVYHQAMNFSWKNGQASKKQCVVTISKWLLLDILINIIEIIAHKIRSLELWLIVLFNIGIVWCLPMYLYLNDTLIHNRVINLHQFPYLAILNTTNDDYISAMMCSQYDYYAVNILCLSVLILVSELVTQQVIFRTFYQWCHKINGSIVQRSHKQQIIELTINYWLVTSLIMIKWHLLYHWQILIMIMYVVLMIIIVCRCIGYIFAPTENLFSIWWMDISFEQRYHQYSVYSGPTLKLYYCIQGYISHSLVSVTPRTLQYGINFIKSIKILQKTDMDTHYAYYLRDRFESFVFWIFVDATVGKYRLGGILSSIYTIILKSYKWYESSMFVFTSYLLPKLKQIAHQGNNSVTGIPTQKRVVLVGFKNKSMYCIKRALSLLAQLIVNLSQQIADQIFYLAIVLVVELSVICLSILLGITHSITVSDIFDTHDGSEFNTEEKPSPLPINNILFASIAVPNYVKLLWTFNNFECYNPWYKMYVTGQWIFYGNMIYFLFLIMFGFGFNCRYRFVMFDILFHSFCLSGKFDAPRLEQRKKSRVRHIFCDFINIRQKFKIDKLVLMFQKQALKEFIPNNHICYIIIDYCKELTYAQTLELKFPTKICNSLVIYDKENIWIDKMHKYWLSFRNEPAIYFVWEFGVLTAAVGHIKDENITKVKINDVWCLVCKFNLVKISSWNQKEIAKRFYNIMKYRFKHEIQRNDPNSQLYYQWNFHQLIE